MFVNWKTTTWGVIGFLAIFLPQLVLEFDGKPETIANWTIVIAAAAAMFGLAEARDRGKSTEDQKLKK
jgi:hypothetical protein